MQEDKKKKIKSFLGKAAVFLVMLGISIATASVNLTQELENFVRRFFDAAVEYGSEETDEHSIYVKGDHTVIQVGEYKRACEIEELLAKGDETGKALQQLKEIKILGHYGNQAGFSATSKQINQKIEDLKQQLQEQNAFQYKAMCDEWESEKKFWDAMEDLIKEQIIAEQVLDEKREEFSNRVDIDDVDAALQAYIDELVEKEHFYVVE